MSRGITLNGFGFQVPANAGSFTLGGQQAGWPGYDGTLIVSGKRLTNSSTATVQLRGASIQQSAFAVTTTNCATLGSTGVKDASGGGSGSGSPPNDQNATLTGSGTSQSLVATGPVLSYMQQWKMNCIRIGINEAA